MQAARYSSEDAAQIVEYVQLVILFTRKHIPYTRTLDYLNILKEEQREEQLAFLEAKKLREDEENSVEVNAYIHALENVYY